VDVKFLERITWNNQLKSQSSCSPSKRPCKGGGNGDNGGNNSGECVPSKSVTQTPSWSSNKGNVKVTISFGCNGYGDPGSGGGENSPSSCRPQPGKEYSTVISSQGDGSGSGGGGGGGGGGGSGSGGCVKVCVST